jgi:hypothetical protein
MYIFTLKLSSTQEAKSQTVKIYLFWCLETKICLIVSLNVLSVFQSFFLCRDTEDVFLLSQSQSVVYMCVCVCEFFCFLVN